MICRCGHDASKHHRAKSCTAIVDEARLKYCKCEEFREVENKIEGDEMAKTKKSKAVRGEKLYEAFSSKIEASAIGKKAASKEVTSHTPLVAQVLSKFSRPATFEQVFSAVKETKRYSENKLKTEVFERSVRGDLAILVREGLAKATKIEASTKANSALKPKRVRKPRAARPKSIETATQAAEATA